MTLVHKKTLAAIAGLTGLAAMILMPSAQAGNYRHHWHPVGRHMVRFHGCKKVVKQRFCRVRHGYRQCEVRRWVRFVC